MENELKNCPHCNNPVIWCGDTQGDEHICDQIKCPTCEYNFDVHSDVVSGSEDIQDARRKVTEIWNTRSSNEWILIDKAPKDGTYILAIEDSDQCVVCWDGEEWRDHSDIGASGMTVFEPTHFMPLPSPPID